jgi:hypothetical protein
MKKLIFCTQEVNKSNIRRENRIGVEHIIITSFTLPPNIVMNRVLYPRDITARDFETFNRTPATIEHPQINGNFVPASDPEADIEFRIGAFNENAEIMEDGRLKLDKVVNVQKAMMTEKGKRLLDRIEEIETSSDARPMHTSVGVFVDAEEMDEPQLEFNGVKTNAEFDFIATAMMGDHDAFLLDSPGAATPSQGTGIGINSEQLKVSEHFLVNDCIPDLRESKDLRTNQELSFDQIRDGLYKALKDKLKGIEDIYPWIVEIYDDNFIYELENTMYRASYEVDDAGNVSIQDNKQEVVLQKEYVDKATQSIKTTEGDDMISRAKLIELLTSAKIEVNADISDTDLMAKFNDALLANDGNSGAEITVNKELTETVTGLTAEIGTLKAQLKENSDKGISDKVATIKACSKYAAIPESALTLMANSDPKDFESMFTDSIPSASIGFTHLNNDSKKHDKDRFAVYTGDES